MKKIIIVYYKSNIKVGDISEQISLVRDFFLEEIYTWKRWSLYITNIS